MKKIYWLVLMLFCVCTCSAHAEISVYFTPSAQCEDAISKRINATEKTLDIAVYAFNNKKIAAALRNAKKRGVKIRFLTDKLQAAGNASDVIALFDEGFDIRVHTKHKIEHNKFAVYDGKSISTGSFNWTVPASTSNSENCLFVDDDDAVAAVYARRFEELWEMNTKEKSDAGIFKIKNRQTEKRRATKKVVKSRP